MPGLRIAVIMGGTSLERDFSLKSGKNVIRHLEKAGHEILPLDAGSGLVDTLREERPDVAFICMHGAGGEDGTVPALLEFLRIPYVGSRAPVCRAAWNKPDIPLVLRRAFGEDEFAAAWPSEVALPARAFRDLGAAKALDLVADRIGGGFPLAVKPARGGSAMGVSRVDSAEDLGEAIMEALAFDDAVLIQEWVEGVELAVSVIGEPGDAQALPPVEINAVDGLYDTEARLDPDRVEHFCPVRPSSLASNEAEAASVRSEIERVALEAFEAFACRDLARIDMIWDGAAARILDIKTFPGMAETSLVPIAAEAAGIGLEPLLDELVRTAYERGW